MVKVDLVKGQMSISPSTPPHCVPAAGDFKFPPKTDVSFIEMEALTAEQHEDGLQKHKC